MRILLLNQFFWPDVAATAQLLTDLARELAERGHSVTVICGQTGYARGATSPRPPVTIRRTPNAPFARTVFGRMLSYLTFLGGAACLGLRAARPDVILSLTTPPGLAVLGAWLATVRGAQHYIWEMDVYPDVAVALGVFRVGSPLTRVLGRLFNAARRRADGLIALGQCMYERLQSRGVPPERIHVVENWADGRALHPLPFQRDGALTVLYSGNLGLAHDLDSIRLAAAALRNDPRFRFIFAGGGPLRSDLEEFCRREGLAHVQFRPYCPREELGRSLGESHLGLVTQRPETIGCVVSSKVYGIMAAGRPVLFIGPREATPARIIRRFQCGWQVDPGDADGVVCILRRLADNPELIHQSGQRGHAAFLEHYDLPIGVARVCRIIGAAPVHSCIREAAVMAVRATQA